MVIRTRSGPYTFGDFLELVSEDRKADLLDGVIHMASPESIDHNRLVAWFGKVIGLFVEEQRLGEITINRVAFRLTDKTAPEPDLGFVHTRRMHAMKSGYVDGPPDLAVEIISPESVVRDYEDKRRRYEAAGVEEYWIIDADEERATFLVLKGDRFEESVPVDHIFRSSVLAGFELDVRWLWQRPLPATLKIVQEMLARLDRSSSDS